jgi:hypothetical protein
MALGAGLWAVGVLAIHQLAPFGVFLPDAGAILLLAALPMAWLTVRLAVRVAGEAGPDPLTAVAIVSAPALLLDGLALTWAPSIYAGSAGEQRAAGAWLLWFVGVSLLIAIARAGVSPARRG